MDWSKEATRMKLENEINLAKQKWRPEAQGLYFSMSDKEARQKFGVQYKSKDGKMTEKYK